jgi:putative holliday junction resolvase
MSRVLGIDYGERRVGLALSDESHTVATPWQVVAVTSLERAAKEVARLLADQDVGEMVIGRPVRMDGQDGPAAERAQVFGGYLAAATGLTPVYWDERFSSKTAEQALIAGGTRRQQRKQVIDKLAAQIILQHYLDAKAGLPDPLCMPDEGWENPVDHSAMERHRRSRRH